MQSKTFKLGQKLFTRSICDNNCIFEDVVKSRTEKFITLSSGKRCMVSVNQDGEEYIFPFGRYSMAPVFKASTVPPTSLQEEV